jgi:hypothetical protein
LLLGAGYAVLLYYKNDFIQNPTVQQKRIFIGLAIFRFIAITIIAFFLLSPFIRSRFTDVQKPEIIILQDNSQSVTNTFKTAEDSAKYISDLQKLMNNFSENYSVKLYPFSNKIAENDSLKFNSKSTDISNAISQISNLYSNQNVGAVILASDGIYNQGSNPIYNLSSVKYPVYTVAMGDTVPKKDLKVEKVYHNQIVYLGDKFKIAVDASATGYNNVTSTLSVNDVSAGKKLYAEEITFNKESLQSKEFILEATKAGVQHFRVQLNTVEGEYSTANNVKDFFVEVLDSRQQILILAAAPHPDIAALRQAIENNKNYQVEVKFLSDALGLNYNNYNAIVLHQLPTVNGMPQGLAEQLAKSKTSLWFIAGSQTNIAQLNKMQNAIQVAGGNQSFNDVTATVATNFPLYNITDGLSASTAKMPPLAAPFGQYKIQPTSKVLLQQKIGSVKTEYPLLAFDESGSQKTAVLVGEGLFRWRLYDFQFNKNHDFSNQFIQQVIQYLSVKEDKRPFKVSLTKNIFNENEPIVFEAELYNQSYELINQPEVKLSIKDEAGKATEYTFARSGNGYRLEIGNLPEGNYNYSASTKAADKPHNAAGKFTIAPLQLELLNSVANHQLLYQISNETGAELFYHNQLEALAKKIIENQNIKPVLYDTFKTDSIINLKWIFFLIVSLLSVEWFVRKYLGGY